MSPSIHWRDIESSDSSTSSRKSDSDGSCHSRETAPTVCSYLTRLPQYESYHGKPEDRRHGIEDDDIRDSYGASTSVETYASTSDEDIEDEEEYPEYEMPAYQEVFPSDAFPATPRDFAELFPSSRKLSIRHDDATLDGNMNLRVDTAVETKRGNRQIITLFHLRMQDLKTRDFSLRRYCRESGREVCHSNRKYQKRPSSRPALQRSFSNALATLRHKSDSRPPTASALKRQDSGYESLYGDRDERPETNSGEPPKGAQLLPTNTIKLEFSNYAQVEVKRRGVKSNKRYDFEYWGHAYSWKRVIKHDGDFKAVSYHLYRGDGDSPIAHIAPVRLSPALAHEEAAKGGWIPPSSMWITDERIICGMADIADVIVASGLIALVDDSIKRKFHSKQTTQIFIPLPKTPSFKMEYIGPKRLIDEMFNRSTRPSRQSAQRRISVEA